MLESGSLPVRTHRAQPLEYGSASTSKLGKRSDDQVVQLNRRILVLVGEGHTDTEIAHFLSITAATVGRHRRGLVKAVNKR